MKKVKVNILIPSRLNNSENLPDETLFCEVVKGRTKCSDKIFCENVCVECFNAKTFNIDSI